MTTLDPPEAPLLDATFFTVTYVEVVPPSAAEGATLLKHYRDASCKDDGPVRFEVLQRLDRPNQFTVLAAWKNEQAFEAHLTTAHITELNRELAPLLAAPNDTRQHRGLAVGAARISRGAITAVTHVDVIPQHKDDGAVALQQLAVDSRHHDGNLRFDVWQQTNRPNHFTVVETWSSRRTFDAHGMAAPTKDFRTKLAVMTGALYDERLYKTLD
jgi:quinol monooxygenase YgiN